MAKSTLNNRIKANRGKAFSLIELLIVVAIIGAFTSIGFPAYMEYAKRIKISTAISDILELEPKIARFYSRGASYPNSLADLGPVPIDPWGNAYRYLNLATVKGKGKARKDKSLVPINSDYDLYSMGEDGRSVSPLTAKHSHDDIVRGSNGGFVGLATDY